MKVTLLVVDEAHCISQWGHDFRPDYLYIARFREMLGNPTTVALTATATKRVRGDIVRLLGLSTVPQMVTGFNRPNIYLEVIQIGEGRDRGKLKEIANLLEKWRVGTAIVYVGTRKQAEKVAGFLRDRVGVPTEHYHAGMGSDERTKVQERFINGHLPIIVATNAFGMGIDRADVRLIVHYSIPGSLEAYYQEIGRAGRDNKPSGVVLLYHPDDRKLQDYFIRESNLSYTDLQSIYEALRSRSRCSEQVWVTMKELSQDCRFDEEGVKARVGLQRLEEAGVIEQGIYQGIHHNITLRKWERSEVLQALQSVEAHIQHKKILLEQIIKYAENRSQQCRRRIILDYFDDSSPTKNNTKNACCNVCHSFKVLPTYQLPTKREPTTDTDDRRAEVYIGIRDCVRDYPGRFDKHELVSLLSDKTSGRSSYQNKNKYSGKLRFFEPDEISQKINLMIKRQRLRRNSNGKLIPGTDKDHKPKQSRTKS